MNIGNKIFNSNIKRHFLKINPLNFLLILQIFLFEFYKSNYVFSSENTNNPTVEYLEQIPTNNFYLLGPGDRLSLEVSKVSNLLNSSFSINGEGLADLPRLNKVYVSGLTIAELTEILNEAYKKFVIEPEVKINVISYRPVRVFIDGEVVNPGVYALAGSNSPLSISEALNLESTPILEGVDSREQNNVFFPSLVDIIRTSGGLTENADLTSVTVIRQNSISSGGGRIQTTVNLLKALDGLDPGQNIRILDGDKIQMSYSREPIISQIRKTIKSNLNPKFINVFVGGRVENSGMIKINNTAVLTDAVYLAGGTKVLKGPVRFLRYNNDGSIDNRKFRYRRSAKRGSYENPFLRQGDMVMIGKSKLNIANEVLSEITSPLQGILTSYGFYKLITD